MPMCTSVLQYGQERGVHTGARHSDGPLGLRHEPVWLGTRDNARRHTRGSTGTPPRAYHGPTRGGLLTKAKPLPQHGTATRTTARLCPAATNTPLSSTTLTPTYHRQPPLPPPNPPESPLRTPPHPPRRSRSRRQPATPSRCAQQTYNSNEIHTMLVTRPCVVAKCKGLQSRHTVITTLQLDIARLARFQETRKQGSE